MAVKIGNDLFIVDNSDEDWKVLNYLAEWSEIPHKFDIATGYFEIGALLALDGKWQKLDQVRILMGDEVTKRTHRALAQGLSRVGQLLDPICRAGVETCPHQPDAKGRARQCNPPGGATWHCRKHGRYADFVGQRHSRLRPRAPQKPAFGRHSCSGRILRQSGRAHAVGPRLGLCANGRWHCRSGGVAVAQSGQN